jgi:hypothetical protein
MASPDLGSWNYVIAINFGITDKTSVQSIRIFHSILIGVAQMKRGLMDGTKL